MPRKRRTAKERVGRDLRLCDFSFEEELCFVAAWKPGGERYQAIRWTCWETFLDDYVAIRDELVTTMKSLSLDRPEDWPFAERAMRFRIEHGIDALNAGGYAAIMAYSSGISLAQSSERER